MDLSGIIMKKIDQQNSENAFNFLGKGGGL